MSGRKVKTELAGYDTQIFPERLDELNRIYSLFGANSGSYSLDRFLARIESNILTADGYKWHKGLHFTIKKGRIAVLFPWALDFKRRDGLQLDRSIAVFTKGRVGKKDAETLIEKLCKF
ncbi:MAG: hypothetical protein HY438_01545 [DPANN group archaeon]|nr:hypothetical protein [DPANN group archaeon]